jgi:hypothetical protein
MAIDDPKDPKDLVRRGYDALSWHYRRDDADDGAYGPWLAALRECLPAGAQVLDLGCGCGIPVARSLASAGYAVTGVDFSHVQLQRARRLVPTARLLHADATRVTFPTATFDAVICLYMLFHLPLAEQPVLLGRIASPGPDRPGHRPRQRQRPTCAGCRPGRAARSGVPEARQRSPHGPCTGLTGCCLALCLSRPSSGLGEESRGESVNLGVEVGVSVGSFHPVGVVDALPIEPSRRVRLAPLHFHGGPVLSLGGLGGVESLEALQQPDVPLMTRPLLDQLGDGLAERRFVARRRSRTPLLFVAAGVLLAAVSGGLRLGWVRLPSSEAFVESLAGCRPPCLSTAGPALLAQRVDRRGRDDPFDAARQFRVLGHQRVCL